LSTPKLGKLQKCVFLIVKSLPVGGIAEGRWKMEDGRWKIEDVTIVMVSAIKDVLTAEKVAIKAYVGSRGAIKDSKYTCSGVQTSW
jgi:hypothetical protein